MRSAGSEEKMRAKKASLGIVGCGKISHIYLENFTGMFSDLVDVVICGDINIEAAESRAKEYKIAQWGTPDKVYSNPDVEIVVNLTSPWAHLTVTTAALRAGKNVYSEKPLGMTIEEGQTILSLAAQKKLLVGCAPDTVLGQGIQTCRRLIEDGAIGKPLYGYGRILMDISSAVYHSQRVGGAQLDMGPYFATALVHLLGPVKKVSASVYTCEKERVIDNPQAADHGTEFTVEVPGTTAAMLEFHRGAIAQLVTTAESHMYGPELVIYGTAGNLICNDPNMFSGPIILEKGGKREEISPTHPYGENSRGLGVIDLAAALRGSGKNRADGLLALHVLEILKGAWESAKIGRNVSISTGTIWPDPVPETGISY